MRKHGTTQKLKDILQNNWPVVLKNAYIMKCKESPESYFRLKKVKET